MNKVKKSAKCEYSAGWLASGRKHPAVHSVTFLQLGLKSVDTSTVVVSRLLLRGLEKDSAIAS